ncbi:MAG: S41 family peptidase [Abditibacteriota bacterium]|nr:S41 family peptidase [Abditibacteriota bacterium]
MKSIIKYIICCIIVFMLGVATPILVFAHVTSGRTVIDSGRQMMAALRNFPQKGQVAGVIRKPDLKATDTYTAVMRDLENTYYKKIDPVKVTYSGISGMLTTCEDPFTYFIEPEAYKSMREETEGNFSGIGAVLKKNELGETKIHEIIEGAPAEGAGLLAGDIILKVDDFDCHDKDLDTIVKRIRGEIGTQVTLTISRKGEKTPRTITVTRAVIQETTVTSRMLTEADGFRKADGIGYIRLHQFNQKADAEVDKAWTKLESEGMKALIFDLRGNPGGLLTMAISVGSRFIDKGDVVIIREKGGKRIDVPIERAAQDHPFLPVAVLVNGMSASASEIVSGAIKDNHAGTIIGTVTFGKGLVQSIVPIMTDGSACSITTAKYYTPADIDINKKGIEPDIMIEESENYDPDNIRTDNQLSCAVNVLRVKLGLRDERTLQSYYTQSEKLLREYRSKKAKERKE